MMRKVIAIIFSMLAICCMNASAQDKFTLVIDAGHGGKDSGSPGRICKEKDLTLKFALAFGRMVERNCPDVKVVYTRTTDKFVELSQRAEIANKANADLFISVHINALEGGRIARGFQTYTLGNGTSGGISTNLEVAKRENAVIFLEKDYKQTYQGFDPNSSESNIMFEFIQDKNMERSVDLAKMMQKNVCAATSRADMGAHQANLCVLRLSSMPGCLVECGFITTPDEERFMNTEEAKEMYARGLFNAFASYKNKYFKGVVIPYKSAPPKPAEIPQIVPENYQKTEPAVVETPPQQPVAEPVQETQPAVQETTEPVQDAAPIFKIQVLASRRQLKVGDPLLKGLENIEIFEENGYFKHTCGASSDYNQVYQLRKTLLDKFPEAFIIAFKNGQKVDVNQAIREFKANKNN